LISCFTELKRIWHFYRNSIRPVIEIPKVCFFGDVSQPGITLEIMPVERNRRDHRSNSTASSWHFLTPI